MRLSSPQADYDSGAKPEIVLAVVVAVGEFCQEILGPHGTNRDVSGYTDVNASSRRHPERGYRPEDESVLSPHASEKDVSERCDSGRALG